MSDYGYHPTPYSQESDESFYAHFRESEWSKANEATRLDLLQEAVNRSALAHGEIGTPKVEFADLDPSNDGSQANGIIKVNRDKYAHDIVRQEVDGKTYTMTVKGSNMLALETVLHEDEHAYQDQLKDGTIVPTDLDAAREYEANGFDLSVVDVNGKTDVGLQYLTGSGKDPRSYYAYYTEPTERDAFKFSEMKTMAIMEKLEATYGTEDSFQAYRDHVAINGFNANIDHAKEVFQDDDVVHNVSATLQNAYFKDEEAIPVTNHDTEAFVHLEMQESFEDVHMGGRADQSAVQDDSISDNTSSVDEEIDDGPDNDNGPDMEM